MQQLEETLNVWFGQKAPGLPETAKKLVVSVAPFGAILSVILGVMGLLALFGIGSIGLGLGAISYATGGFSLIKNIVFTGLAVLFEILSIPGLFARNPSGWRFAFYVQLIWLVSGLLGGSVLSPIIGAVVGFWILFQVRPIYMGQSSLVV